MRAREVVFGCVVALALGPGLPARGSALSLADAVASGFTSGDLSFADLSVGISGDLSGDLTDYAVTPVGDGFALSGSLTVLAGQGGTLSLSYRVSTVDPAKSIRGAMAAFDGQVLGTGAFALGMGAFTDTGLDSLGSVFVYELGGDVTRWSDSTTFGDDGNAVRVTQTLQVDAHGPGALLATIGALQQQFLVVEEPDPWLLFAVGALGLYGLGRRRLPGGGRGEA